jgi:hypothetical protein
MSEEPAIVEDTGLREVHEEILNVISWIRYWAQEGFIFYSTPTTGTGSVVLTRGVTNDFKALADELAWIADMLPVGDDTQDS